MVGVHSLMFVRVIRDTNWIRRISTSAILIVRVLAFKANVPLRMYVIVIQVCIIQFFVNIYFRYKHSVASKILNSFGYYNIRQSDYDIISLQTGAHSQDYYFIFSFKTVKAMKYSILNYFTLCVHTFIKSARETVNLR